MEILVALNQTDGFILTSSLNASDLWTKTTYGFK